MSEQYSIGERIRHANRPEWGIGTITRVDRLQMQGQVGQRLEIRFANAGVKTISSLGADLERIGQPGATVPSNGTFADREARHETGWLGEIAKNKPEEALVELPEEVTDPFRSVRDRLERTLGLFRFEQSGGKLIDWAVARTGLDDPLSRFTRQDLEQYFSRWAFARQQHLHKLLKEAKNEHAKIDDLLQKALPEAKRAMQQNNARR